MGFTDAEHYAYRADVYCGRGEFDAALLDLDQAIILYPTYRWAFYRRGFVFCLKGNLQAALADLVRALDLSPDYVAARLELVRVYTQLNDKQSALEQLREVERDQPGSRRAKYLRWLLCQMGSDCDIAGDFSQVPITAEEKDAYELLCNSALFSLATGSEGHIRQIIEDASEVQMRMTVVPELRLFLAVFQGDHVVCDLIKCACKRLGKRRSNDCSGEGMMNPSERKTEPQKREWHPVYCPLHHIAGLEREKSELWQY